ncbi:hypothetical protein, partial [Sphaerotilus natans]|uniref:hypothetical protein n=1 Tax=Sphaerotilus natans TaxID=34103 RepID=UPI0019D3A954
GHRQASIPANPSDLLVRGVFALVHLILSRMKKRPAGRFSENSGALVQGASTHITLTIASAT